MNTRILHFTLGPIQDFIFQARRTRDLWGGSFLLSWLSGIAMKQVIEAGGQIIFPAVHDEARSPTDALLAAIFGGDPQPRAF
jgi:CRISPR-associated protein Cmr2